MTEFLSLILENMGLTSPVIHTSQISCFNTKLAYNRTATPSMPNYNYDPSGHMYTILIWMGGDVDGRDLKNNLWVKGREGYQQANWNYAWYNNPWFGAKTLKTVLLQMSIVPRQD